MTPDTIKPKKRKKKLSLEKRIAVAAEQVLYANKYVRPLDVLLMIGWLSPTHLKDWQRGKAPFLEKIICCNLTKLTKAMKSLHKWALARGLKPTRIKYMSHTVQAKPLRFTKGGIRFLEERYSMHYISPILDKKKLKKLGILVEKEALEKAKDIDLPPPLNIIDNVTAAEKALG